MESHRLLPEAEHHLISSNQAKSAYQDLAQHVGFLNFCKDINYAYNEADTALASLELTRDEVYKWNAYRTALRHIIDLYYATTEADLEEDEDDEDATQDLN